MMPAAGSGVGAAPACRLERNVNVVITQRHGVVNPEVEDYARKKIERLGRFFDPNHLQSALIVLQDDNGDHGVEMTLVVDRGPTLVAHGSGSGWFDSITQAESKLEAQLKQHKERLVHRHRGR